MKAPLRQIHASQEVFMQTLLQDLRYAIRRLSKSPGFTFAVGIGANTAIFSSMDAVVLRPLAVPQMDRVVTIDEQKEQGQLYRVALANFGDWQQQNKSFEEMSVHTPADMSLTGSGDAAHVGVTLASANFFSVLRAQPVIGRV